MFWLGFVYVLCLLHVSDIPSWRIDRGGGLLKQPYVYVDVSDFLDGEFLECVLFGIIFDGKIEIVCWYGIPIYASIGRELMGFIFLICAMNSMELDVISCC